VHVEIAPIKILMTWCESNIELSRSKLKGSLKFV